MAKLTAAAVRGMNKPGRYADGAGLYLQVQSPTQKSWLFRYMIRGKARQMGIGPALGARSVTLAEAREKARDAHALLRQGTDPLQHRRTAVSDEPGHSFRDVADLYLAAHGPTWRSAKHRAQWRTTLETYAYPVFGALPVRAVGTGEVMAVLEPIWREKPETASRLRGRIEAVLDYAAARGWRSGENPARWRGHVANLLPRRSKVRAVVHHPALPWREVGAFMAELRGREATAALALEMVVLTAARAGEVLGMRWSEIDLAGRVWTVPAKRMKAAREHRVPLSEAATAVLARMEAARPRGGDGFVFPGAKVGRPLSEMAIRRLLERMERTGLTTHGFRSTFRDWCAEATNYPRELAEAALAHAVADKVEAAYRRGDLFEKRRALMEDWAAFCAKAPAAVMALRGPAEVPAGADSAESTNRPPAVRGRPAAR